MLCWKVPSLDPLVLLVRISSKKRMCSSGGMTVMVESKNPRRETRPLATLQPQVKVKVKFPESSNENSYGGWSFGLPSFLWHSAQRGMQELPAVRFARTYPPRKLLVTHFCYTPSGHCDCWMPVDGRGHLKVCKDSTGSRTWNLCSLLWRSASANWAPLAPPSQMQYLIAGDRTRTSTVIYLLLTTWV